MSDNCKLEQMDAGLFDKVQRISDAITGGEYGQARLLCRTLEDDLQQVNTYAKSFG